MNHSVKNKTKKKEILFCYFFFGAWDGAGGAVTSCLKLHEVFTKPSAHQIPLYSALSGFYFIFPGSKCKKGTFWWLAGLLFLFWLHILFKALKGSSSSGKAISLMFFLLPNLKHHLWMSEGMRRLLCFCKHTVQSEVYVHLKTRCFHNHTQCCGVFQTLSPHFV